MGTRTYSRRGANGVRIPTALGIRTGKFQAVRETPANTSATSELDNLNQVVESEPYEPNYGASNYTYDIDGNGITSQNGNWEDSPLRTMDTLANTVKEAVKELNKPDSVQRGVLDDISIAALAGHLRSLYRGLNRINSNIRSANAAIEEFNDYLQDSVAEDKQMREYRRIMRGVSNFTDDMARRISNTLETAGDRGTQGGTRVMNKFYQLADVLRQFSQYIRDGAESGFIEVD